MAERLTEAERVALRVLAEGPETAFSIGCEIILAERSAGKNPKAVGGSVAGKLRNRRLAAQVFDEGFDVARRPPGHPALALIGAMLDGLIAKEGHQHG